MKTLAALAASLLISFSGVVISQTNSDNNTDIFSFQVEIVGCNCNLVNKIDPFLHRIYIRVPNETNISNLAPKSILLANGATINPSATTARDWTLGAQDYMVTASDGTTQQKWSVLIENPKCQETDIQQCGFNLNNKTIYGTIDYNSHVVSAIVPIGDPINNVNIFISPSCSAIMQINGIDQNSPLMNIDFTSTPSIRVRIVAEDNLIYQDWDISLKVPDVIPPLVSMNAQDLWNCGEHAIIRSNEKGRVMLVNSSLFINGAPPTDLLTKWNTYANNRLVSFNYYNIENSDAIVSVQSLFAGLYYGIAVDENNNISLPSTNTVSIQACEVEVTSLCDLQYPAPSWLYNLIDEVYITYEETSSGGNIKFVQNTSCGIQIVDRNSVLPVNYGQGTLIKGLKGFIDVSGPQRLFIPIQGNSPVILSTGNVIQPICFTYEDFEMTCSKSRYFESVLVRIESPMIARNLYGQGSNWTLDGKDLQTTNVNGLSKRFLLSAFNSELIGRPIDINPKVYQGIRVNVNIGTQQSPSYMGCIVPRGTQDILNFSPSRITGVAYPEKISGILVGDCGTINIKVANEGFSGTSISEVRLVNGQENNGFSIESLVQLPFELTSWTNLNLTLKYCPIEAGTSSGAVIIKTSDGQEIVVPYEGSAFNSINNLPYSENFNSWPPGSYSFGGWVGNMIGNSGAKRLGTNGFAAVRGSKGYSYVINPNYLNAIGSLKSPGFYVSSSIPEPVISFYQGRIYGSINGSPIRLLISTDKVNWTQIWSDKIMNLYDVYSSSGPWKYIEIPISAFKGQVIYLKWEAQQIASQSFYWIIEDISVEDKITGPIPELRGDLNNWYANLGATAEKDFTIINSGISILEINSINIEGTGFSLVNPIPHPLNIQAENGPFAFGDQLVAKYVFKVRFLPINIGLNAGTLIIDYGPNHNTIRYDLSGESSSCTYALKANKGANWAPRQNTWWEYTATYPQLVTINSCHPFQDVGYSNLYAWDTYLKVYSDCNGTLIKYNDDMEGGCVFNRASSEVTIQMATGQTIYFFWPLEFPTAIHYNEGFFFNLIASEPVFACDFTADHSLVNSGETVNFVDLSTDQPDSWYWEFEGGNVSYSTLKNPSGIIYHNPGIYKVKLTVKYGEITKTQSREGFISVVDPNQQNTLTWSDNFTIGGLKSSIFEGQNGWTFVDNSPYWMHWQVRNYGISGCQAQEGPMPSTTGSTGYLVLPADEYNCRNGSQTGNLVDAYAQSPSIDCSNLDVVVLNFEQRFKVCCTTPIMEVQVSADGGNTWRSYDIFKDRTLDAIIGNPVEKVELNITEVASRQPDVRIRFYWKGSSVYYWMIDDMSVGGYTFCQPMDITIQGSSMVYYGYAPMASTTLIPVISGGTGPFTYHWNTGSSGSSLKVSPTSTTEYSLEVTDANGCIGSASFTVKVEDVRCGNKMDKVIVCVNDKNPHTICISPDAVPAQLALGNYLGSCKKNGLPLDPDEIPSELSFSMYPNPSYDKVTMEISGISSGQMYVIVKDVLGRTVIFDQIPTTTTDLKHEIRLYQSGMYHVILQTEKENVTKQLVIIN